MSEQGIEVRLGPQVQDLGVVRMVQVGKDTQELPIDVFHGRWEVGREIVSYEVIRKRRCARHAVSLRTRLGREGIFVVQQVLDPCHDIIDVRRCSQLHALAILVDPCIV